MKRLFQRLDLADSITGCFSFVVGPTQVMPLKSFVYPLSYQPPHVTWTYHQRTKAGCLPFSLSVCSLVATVGDPSGTLMDAATLSLSL